jgi:hypothetical protein
MIPINCLITTSGNEGREMGRRKSDNFLNLSVLFLRQSWLTAFRVSSVRVVHDVREILRAASTLAPGTSVPLFDCHVPHTSLASSSYFARYFYSVQFSSRYEYYDDGLFTYGIVCGRAKYWFWGNRSTWLSFQINCEHSMNDYMVYQGCPISKH